MPGLKTTDVVLQVAADPERKLVTFAATDTDRPRIQALVEGSEAIALVSP